MGAGAGTARPQKKYVPDTPTVPAQEDLEKRETDAKSGEDFDAGKPSREYDSGASPDEAVYHWLQWGPARGSPCHSTLKRCFPGAIPGTVVLQRVVDALEPLGVEEGSVIYGQSICPDEINNEKGDLSSLMIGHWGNVFPMGGIGGAPFVGKTGFAAFSGHVPEGGHVIVLFGPHIAISESGELAKYLRDGQASHSSACGAVMAAFGQVSQGMDSTSYDSLDIEQSWIRKKVAPQMDNITASAEPINALIHAAYVAIKEEIMTITNTRFGTGKLILIGGVQINMPAPCQDYFEPLLFQMESQSEAACDLLDHLKFTTAPRQQSPFDVFSWLRWAPSVGTECYNTLHRCFPGAVPGEVVVQRSAVRLADFGLEPGNTIYGQSICPDEINNEEDDLASLMADLWGNCFPMGGIGGAPFVGKTGFKAFSHHVPDGGHVVILFGPHIAISSTGELGKYLRVGQSHESSACGAVLAAYNAVRNGDSCEFDENDMQQCWIKRSVQSHVQDIVNESEPISALIHFAYEDVRDKILEIVNHEYGSGYLVLIGGIQINMPPPFQDHFEPLLFRISSANCAPLDLLDCLAPREQLDPHDLKDMGN